MKILVYDDNGVTPIGFLSNVQLDGDFALISIAGLVVGSGAVTQGHGDPTGIPPSNPDIPTNYTDLDTGIGYVWNVETQVWI